MKIKLQVQQINHAPDFSYHCIDDTHLVINGALFSLDDGVTWPNTMKDSGGLVMSVTKDADGTVWELLCQYVSAYPNSAECALHVAAPETIDTTGMEVVMISSQTQEEIDTASALVAAKATVATDGAYLSSTDWYAVRYAEAGTSIPDDVKTKRASFRTEISELRAKYNLS
jgi:hypothetical protein